ncbi:hypothetical protein EA473_18545 [Natrarchaeobius chitinivorans]|uniref:Uncharacterized protein n=1 Tax=Natrarchaeobius chitinivorans TaxID=1679083 RepID=A0A3N6LQC9_NATCH|nr:hypothetical protein EA473_18545 [Natrarchaeobius chitinivorans]
MRTSLERSHPFHVDPARNRSNPVYEIGRLPFSITITPFFEIDQSSLTESPSTTRPTNSGVSVGRSRM